MSTLRRRAARAGVLLAVAATCLPALPAHASGDRWTVPHSASITIRGHGFGHGHGMSQYGAEGAARQGLTYRQIANFYYEGTSWGTANGRVDVLITGNTTDDLVVLARKGLVLRDRAAGERTELPDNGATRWRIAPLKDGGSRVGYLLDGAWHSFGKLEGEGEFSAHAKPVTLVTPSGNRAYRGRLRSTAPSAGSMTRDTVNDVSLESYLKGVVPLEMPAPKPSPLWLGPDRLRR